MSEEQTLSVQELRRMVRLLERIHRLAEESSRRGMMKDGQTYLIQQYHAIISTLAAHGRGLPEYFPPLGDDATLGTVGFASAQVAEYLLESIEAEEGPGEGEGSGAGPSVFEKFFNSGEFQHIGEAMREAMPDWMRAARAHRSEREHRSDRRRDAPSSSPPPASGTPGDINMDVNVDLDVDVEGEPQQELAALNKRVREVTAQMRAPGLPPEEIQRLATELAQLVEQQAQLAQEAAGRSR